MKDIKPIKLDLSTGKYTRVYQETEYTNNAPHYFVVRSGAEELAEINFQNGAIKEVGVNGVMNEDLLAMVIVRLQHFQDTEYACKENAMAITKLEEALLWLRKRTMGREQRGVEGTHEV